MPVFVVAEEEYTGQERAALVAWHLAHGECLTTRQIANMTKLSWDAADELMKRLSRVIPIYRECRKWQVCEYGELA